MLGFRAASALLPPSLGFGVITLDVYRRTLLKGPGGGQFLMGEVPLFSPEASISPGWAT